MGIGGIRMKLALAAGLGAALVAPAASQATVTIGSSLTSGPPNLGPQCPSSVCTRAQVTLPADRTATNGVLSPVNGTVIRWRVRTSAGDTQRPIAFRVVSPAASGQFTGGGSSATVTPPQIEGVTPFDTSVPIKIGDSIGLNYPNLASFYFRIGGGLGAGRFFDPQIALGQTKSATADFGDELLVNAEIEPTSAFSLGKPKSRNGGKLKIRATLPNAGTLVAGLKGDKKIPAATAAKVVKRTTRTVSAPGELTFKVKPTKATQKRLAGGDTVKVRIKVAFTPTNGKTATRTIKAKLKG